MTQTDSTGTAATTEQPSDTKPTGDVQMRLFARTDVGQVREHNEDNFLVADLSRRARGLHEANKPLGIGKNGHLLAVCDGMGGAAAGEVASQLAVDIIYECMVDGLDPEVPTTRNDLARRLVRAVEIAGQRIFHEAKADRSRRGMGTTVTAAAFVDDHLFLAQVGDSRGYILREGTLVQVTRDQSLVNQLIEAGQLTEEEAETFEHNNIILQALGTSDTVQVDLTHVELRRGDTLMLCSDGLSGMIRNDEIREILRSVEDPLESCKVLTDRANQAGGHDNITVVVAKFEGDGLDEATQEDVDRLRYEKYQLPNRTPDRGETLPEPRRVKELDTAKISLRPPRPEGGDGGGHDDDPNDGGSLPDYDRFHNDEPVQIPVEGAPQWLIVMMIASAVACMIVVGYVYLIK